VANRVGYYDLSADDAGETLHERMAFDHMLGSLPVKMSLGTPRTSDSGAIVLPVQRDADGEGDTAAARSRLCRSRARLPFDLRPEGTQRRLSHQTQEVTMTTAEHDKSNASRSATA